MNLTAYEKTILRAAQEYWKSRGWYHGDIDGLWGKQSSKALQTYEKELNAGKTFFESLSIEKIPSPNYGGVHVPRRIILHHCAGTWAGTVSWIKQERSNVSYHYYISQAGKIVQFVPPDKIAWHARGHNPGSIGIAFQGDTVTGAYRSSRHLTGSEINACVKLISALLRTYSTINEITTHRAVDPTRKNDISPSAEMQIREAL